MGRQKRELSAPRQLLLNVWPLPALVMPSISGGSMMKKVIIQDNQRGLLFRNGKYVKLLDTGKYYTYGGRAIQVMETSQPIVSDRVSIQTLLRDPEAAKQTAFIEVSDEHMAMHFVNGTFADALRPGRYLYWNVQDEHTWFDVDISTPEVAQDFPVYLFGHMPATRYSRLEVAQWQKGLLFYDQKLVRVLDAGTYYFWKGHTQVSAKLLDTRLIQMDITGQEILTADKVSLRINFICHYRITDFVKIATEIADYEEQMHVLAQMALREYVAKYRMDELLENKEQISTYVMEKLSEQAPKLYVQIQDAGIKDIILPGEIREIMNTVLIAEKRAQANVITRREEVASTRSLLNTAKLMDENRTLFKLKELEYIEKICEHVGSINVGSNAGLLDQLTRVLTDNEATAVQQD